MKKPFKLVYVEWEDSFGCSASWCDLENTAAPEDIEPQLAKSVGWLCRENASSITIIPHISDESEYAKAQGCGDMTIPKSAIRKRRVLSIFKDDKLTAAGRRVRRRKPPKPGKPPH